MAPDATLPAVRGTSRPTALALVVVLSVAAVGCGSRTLRTDQLERRLARELSEALSVSDIRVECPSEIEVRRGDRFDCTATAPDRTDRVRIEVTQVDDEGSITWEFAGDDG
jgi:Domain of unknown function (DUF4333)